jgi:hypothetical protein
VPEAEKDILSEVPHDPDLPVLVMQEGDIGPGHGYQRKSDADLKKLALDLVEGRAFGSWQIPAHQQHMVQMVFMPLGFMDDIGWKQMEADDIVHFYGYMDKTFPRSVNGMPIFQSMHMLNREDTQRLKPHIERLLEIRREFMGEDKGGG